MLIDREIAPIIFPFGGSDHWSIQLEIKGSILLGIDPSNLRISGSPTQISSATLKNGGPNICRYRAQICSSYIKD